MDAVVGFMDMYQYAEFIEAIIESETGHAINRKTQKLIDQAKSAVMGDVVVSSLGAEREDSLVEQAKKKEELGNKEKVAREHIKVQWVLKQLGTMLGCKVFVAKNDSNQMYNGERLGEGCISESELPMTGIPEQLWKRVILIDVVWVKNNAIVCTFEVECTTSIYSGILRMSDLIYAIPNTLIKGYIIVPDARKRRVIDELNRPTFTKTHRFLKYITIEELKDLHQNLIKIKAKPGTLNEEIMDEYAQNV